MVKQSRKAAAMVTRECIDVIRSRHREATTIIEAATLLAKRWQTKRAIKTLMEFEEPTHDQLETFRAILTISREMMSSDDQF